MTPITATIHFSVNDRVRSIRRLIEEISCFAAREEGQILRIDLRKCQYLGPDAIALLGAVLLDFKSSTKVEVLGPEGPPALRTFFEACGLETLIHGVQSVPKNPNLELPNVLSLTQFQKASFQDADPIMKMLHRFDAIDPEQEESLRVCVNEAIQNVQDHAKSPVGAMMTARFMAKDKEVRVAIVDRGIGVRSSLSKRYPDTTPENVMQRVLSGNYTALSRENNKGLGLSLLASIVENLGGDLFILSESSTAELRRGSKKSFMKLTSGFRGTGVFFTLPVGA